MAWRARELKSNRACRFEEGAVGKILAGAEVMERVDDFSAIVGRNFATKGHYTLARGPALGRRPRASGVGRPPLPRGSEGPVLFSLATGERGAGRSRWSPVDAVPYRRARPLPH